MNETLPDRPRYGKYAEFNEARREEFYERLAACGIIQHSAFAVGVHPKTEFKLRKADPEHALRVEECMAAYRQSIEDEIRRRGLEGYEKPLVFQGQLTGDYVTEYSDQLLLAHAKRHIPEYTDRGAPAEGGGEGHALPEQINIRDLTPEQRNALRVLLAPETEAVVVNDVDDAEIVEANNAPSQK